MAEEKYYVAMDPYPQQKKEFTKLYKFYDYLKEGKLTTTRCKSCGYLPWPPRTICPECISDELEWVEFPDTGKIYAFTVLVNAVPLGYKPPLIFALIDFPNGLRIFSTLVDANPDEIRVGSEVELEVQSITDGRVLPGFKLKGH